MTTFDLTSLLKGSEYVWVAAANRARNIWWNEPRWCLWKEAEFITNQAERIGDPQAVKNWESYKSTWMQVERVQSNKKSCDQSHVTEDQEIFLRILAENVAGVQRNGRWHSTCAQVPWTNLTSCSAGLKWRAPSSTDGLPITSYLAERCDKLWESQVKACLTKGGMTTFDVTSLVEGSEYHFWVAAANVEG